MKIAGKLLKRLGVFKKTQASEETEALKSLERIESEDMDQKGFRSIAHALAVPEGAQGASESQGGPHEIPQGEASGGKGERKKVASQAPCFPKKAAQKQGFFAEMVHLSFFYLSTENRVL
jgi:hypothetical protein